VRSSAYVGQSDQHLAALTVRETLNFSEACLGPSEVAGRLLRGVAEWEAAHGVEKSDEDEKVGGQHQRFDARGRVLVHISPARGTCIAAQLYLLGFGPCDGFLDEVFSAHFGPACVTRSHAHAHVHTHTHTYTQTHTHARARNAQADSLMAHWVAGHHGVMTEYMLMVLGLQHAGDTLVGDAMLRGIRWACGVGAWTVVGCTGAKVKGPR
jgi:hypothetical protein